MAKAKTINERAEALARKWKYRGGSYAAGVYRGYIAGYRANRLTRAERAVVEAAFRWGSTPPDDKASETALMDALATLVVARARAKGRK